MEKLHLRFDISAIHVYAVRHLPNSVERAGGATEWDITNGDDTEYSLRRQSKPRANNESDTHRTSTGVRGQGPGRGPGGRGPGAAGNRGSGVRAGRALRHRASGVQQHVPALDLFALPLAQFLPVPLLLPARRAVSQREPAHHLVTLHAASPPHRHHQRHLRQLE